MGCGGSNVAIFPLNCKIIERLVLIDPVFKHRRLPILQKWSKGSLERHFTLVRTIQVKNSPNLHFQLHKYQTLYINQILFTINGHSAPIDKLNKAYTHQKIEFEFAHS